MTAEVFFDLRKEEIFKGKEGSTKQECCDFARMYIDFLVKDLTKDSNKMLEGFKEEFKIGKYDNSPNVISFNWFTKCTTLKELSEICARVSNKMIIKNLKL